MEKEDWLDIWNFLWWYAAGTVALCVFFAVLGYANGCVLQGVYLALQVSGFIASLILCLFIIGFFFYLWDK